MDVRYACEPAPDAAVNEDHVLHTGPLVAIFDGVSAPQGLDTGYIHGTSWYVDRLAGRLTETTATPDIDLRHGLAAAIEAVRGDHGGTCDPTHPGTPAASLCIIRERGDTLDYLILCDCTLVADPAGQTQMHTDTRFTNAMADIRATTLTGGAPIGSPEHAAQVRHATQQRSPTVAARRRGRGDRCRAAPFLGAGAPAVRIGLPAFWRRLQETRGATL